MSHSFEVDTVGNAHLAELHSRTTAEHNLWLVENGLPVAPGLYPEQMKGFIPVAKYLPIMHDNNDNYSSSTCLLLIQPKGSEKCDITTGFLMKFKDGTNYFWYNHDAIENVIGFKPLPGTKMGTVSKNKRIGNWG